MFARLSHHRIIALMLLCLFLGLFGSVHSSVRADEPVAVIVQVADGVDTATIAADYNATITGELPSLLLARVEGNDAQLVSQLAADPRVRVAHADSVMVGQPLLIGAVGTELDAQPGPVGDPAAAYVQQWAVDKLRLPQAQSITRGEGVTVAVLDTGVVMTHTLLVDNLVPGYDFVDDDLSPDDGTDGIDQDGDGVIDEGAGHGTHVAGTVLLVAPEANIMPIRIFNDEGKGTYFDTIAGIVFAVDNGADVINLSGSGPDEIPFLADAVAYAEARDVVVVAAGGVNALGYPASYESVVSAGTVDQLDYLTDFSNFPQMAATVYAPGISIFSGYHSGDYAWWSGNSMATALVAGTAALMQATNSCDAACVRAKLLDTAHPLVADPETQQMYGRIDTFDAVAAAANQFHADFSVQVMAGHQANADDLQLKPFLKVVNKGNSLPLDELTLRYWYTRDGDVGEQLYCDYAEVSCAALEGTFATASAAAQAGAYLELSFADSAGSLLGGHDSGEIQLRIHKDDWTVYDKLNDYSYNGADHYIDWQNVALYHNGQLVWGVEPSPVSVTTVANQQVQYRASDTNATDEGIRPHLQLVNSSDTDVPLAELAMRYWFTDDQTDAIQIYCDYADAGCEHVTAAVGSENGQSYLEVGFSAAAGELAAGGTTSQIQLRMHHQDWAPFDESDDYSFAPTLTSFTDWQNVTLYHNGQLVWGVAP